MSDKELLWMLRNNCGVSKAAVDAAHQAADRIEELEHRLYQCATDLQIYMDAFTDLNAKLEKALTALGEVQRFVKDLEPYADQGHTLVPALQKACEVYTELKGETND